MSFFVFYSWLFSSLIILVGRERAIFLLSFTCNYVVSVRGVYSIMALPIPSI